MFNISNIEGFGDIVNPAFDHPYTDPDLSKSSKDEPPHQQDRNKTGDMPSTPLVLAILGGISFITFSLLR